MVVRGRLKILASAVLTAVFCSSCLTAYAQQASSANYSVNEVFFGNGGDLSDCSSNYCAKMAAGETSVGNASSLGYQTQAGFNSDRYPYLQFIVTSGNIDLGYLSQAYTKTATATFSVKTYLAGGYVVKANGNPPANSVAPFAQLHTLNTPTASSNGTEQFGMNLAANTSPATFGSAPVQIPDNTFSFGAAASNYNQPNFYTYNKGDIVASSSRSSGETDYTISYIFNISNTTQSGQYTFHQDLVATATF